MSQFCLLFALAFFQIHKEPFFEFVYTNCSAIQKIPKKMNEIEAAHIFFDAQIVTLMRTKTKKNEISSGD